MFVKKAFSAITSKLPNLLKTVVSKLPSKISSIASSSGFSEALNFLKTNKIVPENIRNVAKTVTDSRFQKKIADVGTNSVGMAGTALAASSILGPEAGLAVEAIGLGKDMYDLYKGYKEVNERIKEEENYSKRNNLENTYKNEYQEKNKPIRKIMTSGAKIERKPIRGYSGYSGKRYI